MDGHWSTFDLVNINSVYIDHPICSNSGDPHHLIRFAAGTCELHRTFHLCLPGISVAHPIKILPYLKKKIIYKSDNTLLSQRSTLATGSIFFGYDHFYEMLLDNAVSSTSLQAKMMVQVNWRAYECLPASGAVCTNPKQSLRYSAIVYTTLWRTNGESGSL